MSKSSQAKRTTASAPRTTGNTSRPLTASTGTNKTTSRPLSTGAANSKTVSRPIATSGTASKTTSRPLTNASATSSRAARDTTVPRALRDTTAPRPGSNLKRKQAQNDTWTRWRPIIITVASLAVVIAIFFWLSSGSGNNSGTGQAVPANIMSAVSNVPPTNINSIGTGNLTNPMHATPPNTPVIHGSGNLPVVFYNGGEFCPYCAAERWSMVIALSHFGTFKNLHLTTSSSTDVFPSTNTFTFYGSSYTSKYIDFQGVESLDGNQQPLQTLNSQQQTWFSTYDGPPYVPSDQAGGIPFLDFGNQYITISAGYSPSVINGLTWQQIATDLANPSSPIAKSIIGNANYITAAICLLTNNQPSAVCQVPAIAQIEKTLQALPKGK